MDKVPTKVLTRDLLYEARFELPSFRLAARGAELADAALEAFQPLGLKFDDVRFEGGSGNQPPDFVLLCAMPHRGLFVRYRVDGVEVSTNDPSMDAEAGGALLDTVHSVLHTLGATNKLASHKFTFAYHVSLEGVEVASWFKKHSSPPVEGLLPVGLTFASEIPNGMQAIDFQPSYVHPGPNRFFIRLTSRFEEQPHTDLARVVARAVEDLWERMGLEMSWKE